VAPRSVRTSFQNRFQIESVFSLVATLRRNRKLESEVAIDFDEIVIYFGIVVGI